jgi:hypothetical protein
LQCNDRPAKRSLAVALDRALESAVRAYIADRRIGAAVAARWLRWNPADGAALLQLAEALALGGNQLAELTEWLEDIGARDGATPAAVLGAPEIRGILAAPLGRSDKLKRVKARLRTLRYPRLAALEQTLDEAIRSLDLGPGVSVRLPAALEGDEITVEVRARRPEALRDAVDRVARALEAGGFDRIFAQLDEAS